MNGLMQGKRGLIMGVANDHSIAWGIAKALASTAPNSPSPIRARPSDAASRRSRNRSARISWCPATWKTSTPWTPLSMLSTRPGQSIDFVVHAIGFSDKSQLKGSYADVTTRENFSRTMVISCFSFIGDDRRAGRKTKAGQRAHAVIETLEHGKV